MNARRAPARAAMAAAFLLLLGLLSPAQVDAKRWRFLFGYSGLGVADTAGAGMEMLAAATAAAAADVQATVIGSDLNILKQIGVGYVTGGPEVEKALKKIPGIMPDSITKVKEEKLLQPILGDTKGAKGERARELAVAVAAADFEDEVDELTSADEGRELKLTDFKGFAQLQWGLDAINVKGAWERGYTGKMGDGRVRVAVLDTGFYLDHPAIQPNINLKLSKSFVPGEDLQYRPARAVAKDERNPQFSHGTWTSSIIAGVQHGGAGTLGVAPDVQLMLVKVLKDSGTGTDESVVDGIVYAVDNGAHIINLSIDSKPALQTKPGPQSQYQAMARAVAYATYKGVTVIAAAGNRNFNFDRPFNKVVWTTGIPGAITVSATGPVNWGKDPNTNLDLFASQYCNRGSAVVDFAAPGGNQKLFYAGNRDQCQPPGLGAPTSCYNLDWVIGACCYTKERGYYYNWQSGTSAAAPHVTGVAALVLSKAGRPLSPKKVYRILRKTANDINEDSLDPLYGFGVVNAGKMAKADFDKLLN